MKKYRFNTNILQSLFSQAQRAPAGSYPRIIGTAAAKATYLQSAAEKALVEVWAQKALQAIVDAGQSAKKASYVTEIAWPTDSTGDFKIKHYTADKWNSRYESTPNAYATRTGDFKLSEVIDAEDAMPELREQFLKFVPEERRNKIDIRIDEEVGGVLRVRLVPTVTEKSPAWVHKANIPVFSMPPGDTAGTILLVDDDNNASLVQVEDGEVGYVYIIDQTIFGEDGWMKIDMEDYVESFEQRMAEFKNRFYADVRARMRTQQAPVEVKKKVRTTAERDAVISTMEAARLARRERLAATLEGKEAISLLPFLGHGYASSRRWGIEIESGGARGVKAPAGWSRKRDSSLRSAWEGFEEVAEGTRTEQYVVSRIEPENCPSGQNHMPELYSVMRGYYRNPEAPGINGNPACTQCGDIMGEREVPNVTRHYAGSDDCAEFVSPILGSMHSKGLEKLLKPINKQPQNNSAGVHVHVEAKDLTPKQLGSLVYGYDAIEGLIETSYRREVRNFCKLRSTHEIFDILTNLKTTEVDRLRKGDRYVTLNLCSLDRHGTVEFRAMGNVYDYDYLVRWAMFCREMVNLAKAGVTVKEWNSVNSWADLTSLFAKHGKEYIRTVIDSMGGEVPASPRLDTHDGTVSMPSGGETTEKTAKTGSTFAEFAATMDSVAINSRFRNTVESSLAEIGAGNSQRVLVGALASGETEV